MTGFGEDRAQNERLSATVEIRSVNNRHLKVSVRCSDAYLVLENEIEKLVRQNIGRGTVNVTVRVHRLDGSQTQAINAGILKAYWSQVQHLAEELHIAPPHDLGVILSLPGVISQDDRPLVEESDWPFLEGVLNNALKKFHEFRVSDGQAMRTEMASQCGVIESMLAQVVARAPQTIVEYRDKLKVRVQELLKESGGTIADSDLIREVSLMADRCDITEEIARLRSHIDQFLRLLKAEPSSGRKLEFLCQEMVREVNTIGSKANDVSIAHVVVDAKAALEKIRELVQNVE